MKKILIIDDDEEFCEETAEILAGEGYQVETFSDSLKGLQSAKKDDYDILLLDLKMPKISGYDILQDLRNHGVTRPVFVLSGNPLKELGDQDNASEAFRNQILTHAQGIINKPFDITELLTRLKAILGMSKTLSG